MLIIYRRHLRGCGHCGEGRRYRRCKCPIWVDGFLGGREIRRSLGTADWQKAQDFVREWEAKASEPVQPKEPASIKAAGDAFVTDAESRKLAESTISKYRFLFKQLGAFSQKGGLRYLAELDLQTLGEFRSSWKDGP